MKRPRRQYSCGRCGEVGHNLVTCTENLSNVRAHKQAKKQMPKGSKWNSNKGRKRGSGLPRTRRKPFLVNGKTPRKNRLDDWDWLRIAEAKHRMDKEAEPIELSHIGVSQQFCHSLCGYHVKKIPDSDSQWGTYMAFVHQGMTRRGER